MLVSRELEPFGAKSSYRAARTARRAGRLVRGYALVAVSALRFVSETQRNRWGRATLMGKRFRISSMDLNRATQGSWTWWASGTL